MNDRISLVVPLGDTIKDDLIKLVGRESLSSVGIRALHEYKNNRAGTREGKVNLPDWKMWEKYNFDLSQTELEEYIKTLKQLTEISSRILDYKKGISKADTLF